MEKEINLFLEGKDPLGIIDLNDFFPEKPSIATEVEGNERDNKNEDSNLEREQ